MAETFAEHGCSWCREYWIWHSSEPKLIGTSATHQRDVLRCTKCGAYWAVNPWSPAPEVLDEQTARLWLRDSE